MCCKHCLRGEAENADIDFAYIDALLENVDGIGSITFTGGEPTLNVPAILYTLHACEEREISVASFFIATNGKQIPDDFLMAVLKWYAYCWEPEMCSICISTDKYHEHIPGINRTLLEGFSFYRKDEKSVDWDTATLLNRGRARQLSNVCKKTNEFDALTVKKFVNDYFAVMDTVDDQLSIEASIVLTVYGDILCDCDYEFANTDILKICTVQDFNDVCQKMVDAQKITT